MKANRNKLLLLITVLLAIIVLPQMVLAQEQVLPDDNGTQDQCVTVDFDGLPAGTILSNQIPGMTITTDDPINHPPMIFDTSNPTGGDYDLGTPNIDFGGPGRGAGGRIGADGENSVALGNVVIISEDGDSSDPDDNVSGGEVIFTFDSPVVVDYMYFLDIDEPDASVTLFGEGDVELFSTTFGPATFGSMAGNNGVYRVDMGVENVVRVVTDFPGSGAVASVVFCDEVEEPTEEPTPDPTDPPPPPEAICMVDFVVVIDESAAVGPTNFAAQTQFVLNLVNTLPISPGNFNMGVVSFSFFAEVVVPVTDDVVTLVDGLNNNIQANGQSNITSGIQEAQNQLIPGRIGVPKVMLVITDGYINRPLVDVLGVPEPEVAAAAARDAGIDVYAVGVPDAVDGVNLPVLLSMANDPDDQFYREIDFDNINDPSFAQDLSQTICPDVENRAPLAFNDNYNTQEDTLLQVPAPGVLLNDSDPDGDTISVDTFDAVSTQGGSVVVNTATGSFDYTPPAGFTGVDTFTYVITDGELTSNVATVTINVLGEEEPTETPTPEVTPDVTPEVTPDVTPDVTPEVTPPVAECEILRFELWNADTDSIIMILDNGSQIDVSAFNNANVTIVAVTNPSSVGSVEFTLFGPENRADVENATPYSMFGDNENGDYYGERLAVGNYTVTARAFSEAYLRGVLCAEASLNFSVVDNTPQPEPTEPPATTPEPTEPPVTEEPTEQPTEEPTEQPTEAPACQIVRFELWNADTESKLYDLSEGAVINLADLNGARVTIVAIVDPSPVGSTYFDLSGAMTHGQLENSLPYTSFNSDFAGGQNLNVGAYSLTVTAYTESNRGGDVCDQASINFTVVDEQPVIDTPPVGEGGPEGDGPEGDDNPPPPPPPPA